MFAGVEKVITGTQPAPSGGRTVRPMGSFLEAFTSLDHHTRPDCLPQVLAYGRLSYGEQTAGPIVRDRPPVMACGCISRYRTWNVIGKLTQTGTGWSRFNAAENLYTPATAIAASSRA